MASLPTRSFATIVNTITAGMQGRAQALIDFTSGSPLLAIAQAFADLALWLQTLFLEAIALERLVTSFGGDVDSWFAQFGTAFARKGGTSALGALTYTRFTASASTPFIQASTFINGAWTSVAPGFGPAYVTTTDGTQTVVVVADTTNAAYNAASGGYFILAGQTTVTVTAQAVVAGVGGNIGAGTATVSTTPLTGVDQVVNASAFGGGSASETDAAVKLRFVLFILGLSRGDAYGVQYALASMNLNVVYTLTDQFTYAGAAVHGYFYVVADDGTGSPSGAFLTAVTAAVLAVKPLGGWFDVFAPRLVTANVSCNLTILPGYTLLSVDQAAAALITANITALGLGAGLDVYLIAAWIQTVPGVAPGGVSALLLNSVGGDAATIAANNQVRIMPGAVACT